MACAGLLTHGQFLSPFSGMDSRSTYARPQLFNQEDKQ
jgi:hypothetical protein